MGKHEPLSNRERVARRRAALRAQGLRPKQIWVPDTRAPEYLAEVRRQSRLIAGRMGQGDDLAFAEALQYWPAESEGRGD